MKVLTAVIAIVGLSTLAHAESLKDQIKAMDAKVTKCMLKKDIKGFEKIVKAGITKDFKYTEEGRTMTFDEMVSQMKASFQQLSTITQATSTTLKLTEKGNTATALQKHVMKGTMMGPDKKSHTFEMVGTSTDTYKKIGKDWKMSSMNWKNGVMKMDGKPFDPSKMAG